VDATFVGHDLNRGTSAFTKTGRSTPVDPIQDESVKEMLHGYAADGPRLNVDGEEVEPAA
jgi:single-strand DNA-binding protein